MSKYNLDIPSLERGIDITDEEISEIIAEADRIITENKEKPGKIAEACFKKSQCLQKQKRERASRAPIEKALELYPAISEADLIPLKSYYAAAFSRLGSTVEELTEAIRLDPNNAAYFMNRSWCYAGSEYDKAIADLTEAIRLARDEFDKLWSLDRRGDIYADDVGDYDKAIADYTEIIRLDPNGSDSTAFEKRGKAYEALGQHEKASADRDEAERIEKEQYDPEHDLFIKCFLGTLCPEELNSVNEAEKIIEENKETPEKIAEAYLRKSRFEYMLENDTEKGSASIKKALEIYSNMPQAEASRLQLEFVSSLNSQTAGPVRECDKLITKCTEAISLYPDKAGLFNQRGLMYVEKVWYEKKSIEWITALHLHLYSTNYPGSEKTDYKKEYGRAIADYTEAIHLKQAEPEYAAGYFFNRGVAYHNKGEVDLAITDYTEAIRLNPDYVGACAFNSRGIAYDDKGEYDLAIADYSEAIRRKPEYHYAWYNRAFAYESLGQYDTAIADYTGIISLYPENADAYYYRGVAFKTIGQHDKAATDFAKSKSIKENYDGAIYHRKREMCRTSFG
ncbi:hypothetical protein AGMMS50267_11040 [Spirochaetia bacterium]|nr:hypothetical protein AGMMS50267_11040 [Spirochaetia bacterium]